MQHYRAFTPYVEQSILCRLVWFNRTISIVACLTAATGVLAAEQCVVTEGIDAFKTCMA